MNLRDNIKIHNKIAKKYERVHVEIYNDIEQLRLVTSLKNSLSNLQLNRKVKALDLGCGAGNITKHLLDLNCAVVSADTSQGFLDLVKEKFSGRDINTFLLNGINLDGIKSGSIDFVATYSVLHHIPDYMNAVEEMIRVCAPGGIIYIDHEHAPCFWKENQDYKAFLKKALKFNFRKYFDLANYTSKLIRILFNPRFANEGDIHVWSDDHIEWDKIDEMMLSKGLQLLYKDDFLSYSANYHKDVYEEYKSKCSDMRVSCYKKS
jgi:ubiquinone/menaquinone biosynthesis C-methylase UbiE